MLIKSSRTHGQWKNACLYKASNILAIMLLSFTLAANAKTEDATPKQLGKYYFAFDSSQIFAQDKVALQEISKQLLSQSSVPIIIKGYADIIGSHQYNEQLAKRRAQNIADRLITLGIDPKRIQVQSEGDRYPVKDATGKINNKMSRRAIVLNVVPTTSAITPHFFVEIGGGVSFPKIGDGTVHDLGRTNPPSLYSPSKSKIQGVVTASFGVQFERAKTANWFPVSRLGFEYSHGFKSTIHGSVREDPKAPVNYVYQQKISRDTGLLLGKLDVYRFRIAHQSIMPYLLAGFGMSYNSARDYSEIDVPAGGLLGRISPDYTGTSKAQFSYTLGAGLDLPLTASAWLSAEYRYSGYGDLVGYGKGESANFGLSLHNAFKADELMLQFRYIF